MLIRIKAIFSLKLFKVIILALAALSITCAIEASAFVPETLRVGYFQFNGYHMIDANGQRSGYGYDLLQMIRPYMHCRYQYVGYDKGWSEMLPMLESGEIDLVTSAVKTPEKLLKFDFSETSVGISSVLMTVKAGQRKYKNKDYKHWNGIRIGLIPGNSKNKIFHELSIRRGFTYKPCYLEQDNELSQALQSGKVDAVVSGSLRKLNNEVIYEQMDVRPFYIIVKKGNKNLLSRIDAALESLAMDSPGFAGELHQLYYGNHYNEKKHITFTSQELAFIQASKKSNRQFRVLMQPDQYPLEYVKDGAVCGIIAEVAELLAQLSELNFKMVVAKDFQEYCKIRQARQCELVMDIPYSFSWAEEMGYVLTRPYYPVGISVLSYKKNSQNIKLFGSLQDSVLFKVAQQHMPKGCRLLAFPSNEAAIEAVESGQIDGAYLLAPMVDNAILNDDSGRLSQERSSHSIDLSVGIRDDVDSCFTSIISKSVNCISHRDLLKISRNNNIRLVKPLSLRELVTANPLSFSVISIILISVLSGLLVGVMFYYRRSEKSTALLAKNSRMWHVLIDTLPIHIFAKDVTNNFKYIFNNKAREEFFNRPTGLNGLDDFELLPQEVATSRRQADEALAAKGYGVEEIFLQALGVDNKIHQLYNLLVPFSDVDGTKLLLGCSIDQTDLQAARKQSDENAEWLRKTLTSIGDGVLTTDTKGNITLLNPVAEKLLGVTLAECQGHQHTDYFKLLSYTDDSSVASPLEECLRENRIITFANHTDLISRDGTRYHIADSAAPIVGADGQVFGAILVFRDVTQEYRLRDELNRYTQQLREALDQAQRASATKGVFLSQMSHEIRTPLNAIIGYLNIALDSKQKPEKVLECLERGLEASTHLLSIINDILDISSIESGKLKIANEDFDFKQLLTGIVSMFYSQAEKKGIKFELQLRDFSEEWLVGDSLRINQILLNLFSNALKFTPTGGSVVLRLTQLAIVNNRVPIRLEVSDTGCGMSQDFLSRIFTPFEQQDASIARQHGGTGLGLSITKNLVTLMGGTIDVVSQENVGTTFTVLLSFERSAKVKELAEVSFSHLRALVVDDVADDRAYVQMVLSKCGVKSDAVDSGEAAINQIERRLDSRHPYDLCLIDLCLKGINGIETVRQLRQLEGVANNLPIVLVTAYDVSAVLEQARVAGVNRIIQKPLFQSSLFDFLIGSYYQLQEKNSTQDVKQALSGLSILLVEDNAMNMDISTQYLEKAGLKVTPAWNGQEAVEMFTQSEPGQYQAILMDIQMPVMDGYQATAAIRASAHPEAKSIPIIAMTANAFNEDVVKALSMGMNDHVAKPIVYDRLFASLSKLTRMED